MRGWLLGLGAALLGTARRANATDCPAAGVRLPPFHVEFGWESTVAVPHAYWLYKCGKLLETASCGGERMRAVYWFSPSHSNETCQRGAGWRGVHGLYAGAITYQEVFAGTPLRQWAPAPHRAHYRAEPAPWTPQPTSVYIINKHHARHHATGAAPASFFSVALLEQMLTKLRAACPGTGAVYYSNWRFTGPKDDLPGSVVLPLEGAGETDVEVVQRLGGTPLASLAAPDADLNALQMRVMARHSCFLAVQGGDQAFAATFGGAHVVLDKTEADRAEPDGFYAGTLPRLAGGSFRRVRSDFAFLQAMEEAFLADGCRACGT